MRWVNIQTTAGVDGEMREREKEILARDIRVLER